jgi:GTP cyclohydrolase I
MTVRDLTAVADAVDALLTAVGAPRDEHTANTPARSAKAWAHILSGYEQDPSEHLGTTFPVEGDPGLVIVSGIEVHSTCAHHLLPVTGWATVAYRPHLLRGRVVGLSKLSRVVDGFARRLQVQEQLGSQVADAVSLRLWPEGAACIISAEHGCMTIRGVQQRSTLTTTHAWRGEWEQPAHPDRQAVLTEHLARIPR